MLNISQRVSSASLEAIVVSVAREGGAKCTWGYISGYLVLVSGEFTYIKLLGLNDRDFHDLLKRSHIKKIWCIGPQGCLDQDIKEQNMEVPSHVKKMIHYEEKENMWHGT